MSSMLNSEDVDYMSDVINFIDYPIGTDPE